MQLSAKILSHLRFSNHAVRRYLSPVMIALLLAADATAAGAASYIKDVVDYSCGSDLLNPLIADAGRAMPTEMFSSPQMRFQIVTSRGNSVVWAGSLSKQTFDRDPKLAAAIIGRFSDVEILKFFSGRTKREIEEKLHLDRQSIPPQQDDLEEKGAHIFLKFDAGKLQEIAIDCGQVEPAD